MSRGPANRVLRVFYRDYANDVAVASSHPESLLASRVAGLADRLLEGGDNFFGVVDRNDVILQCYVAEDPAELTLELVYPEANGCLRLTLPRAQALARLADLPEQFDESLLAGGEYVD